MADIKEYSIATTIYLKTGLLERTRELRINRSAICQKALQEEVKRVEHQRKATGAG